MFLRKKEYCLDEVRTTNERRAIIQKKKLLRSVYEKWYRALQDACLNGNVVEIGSGAGFIEEFLPKAIKTEILHLQSVDLVCDALNLPFKNQSVADFVMVDVFHHISKTETFLDEMQRCLKKGGRIVMIEPSATLWGRFIWKNFHHEDFDMKPKSWGIDEGSPLWGANGALPWIVFLRDRNRFEQRYPDLRIRKVLYHGAFSYLLSGGFTLRQLVPDCFVSFLLWFEKLFDFQGIHMTVVVEKK